MVARKYGDISDQISAIRKQEVDKRNSRSGEGARRKITQRRGFAEAHRGGMRNPGTQPGVSVPQGERPRPQAQTPCLGQP